MAEPLRQRLERSWSSGHSPRCPTSTPCDWSTSSGPALPAWMVARRDARRTGALSLPRSDRRGTKPYLLRQMDNGMGALTRVSSTLPRRASTSPTRGSSRNALEDTTAVPGAGRRKRPRSSLPGLQRQAHHRVPLPPPASGTAPNASSAALRNVRAARQRVPSRAIAPRVCTATRRFRRGRSRSSIRRRC